MKWHDLLGAVLIDFFEGSPYSVETEMDLSIQKQHPDIVVIRKRKGEFPRTLPDGLAPLAKHNYRKLVSSSTDDLLPEEDFRLFGITARHPEKLAKEMTLEEKAPGVYDMLCGPIRLRLLVIRNLENQPANAMLKLFSPAPDQIQFACRNYRPYSKQTTGIVEDLIQKYQERDMPMATTVQEIYEKIIREAPLKDRLKGLTTKQRLEGLPPEEILEVLPPEKVLKALPLAEIESYLRKKRKGSSKRKP